MKTNQVMIRRMGSYNVLQRTKDGMFNASDIAHQWKRVTGKDKHVTDFLRLDSTQEFINILHQDLHKTETPQLFDNQVLGISLKPGNQAVKVLGIIDKTRAYTNPGGKRFPGEIWFHPYLYLDFTMWMNPLFKLEVIKIVYDQLIEFRHKAGDNYKGLSSALARSNWPNINYAQVAQAMNHIVFGIHRKGLRQDATQEQLRKLTELQKHLAFQINIRDIKSYDQLLIKMRVIWNNRQFLFT